MALSCIFPWNIRSSKNCLGFRRPFLQRLLVLFDAIDESALSEVPDVSRLVNRFERQGISPSLFQGHIEFTVVSFSRKSEEDPVKTGRQSYFFADAVSDPCPSLGISASLFAIRRNDFLLSVVFPYDGLAVDVQNKRITLFAVKGVLRLKKIETLRMGLDRRLDFEDGVSFRDGLLPVDLTEDVGSCALGFCFHELRCRHAAGKNGSNRHHKKERKHSSHHPVSSLKRLLRRGLPC
jgi:hypothetical protein